jgi:hypothetical protein
VVCCRCKDGGLFEDFGGMGWVVVLSLCLLRTLKIEVWTTALGQKWVQASDRFVAKRIEEIAAIWLNCNGNYRHKAGPEVPEMVAPDRSLAALSRPAALRQQISPNFNESKATTSLPVAHSTSALHTWLKTDLLVKAPKNYDSVLQVHQLQFQVLHP